MTINWIAPTVDQACSRLRERGRRVTPQRRAIIQILLDQGKRHVTAEHVLLAVRDIMPDISHATVYNTLYELVEIGVLVELTLGLGERWYDLCTVEHAHLLCIACKRIIDVPITLPPLSPEQTQGFQIIHAQLLLRGYCPDCLNRLAAVE